jgi:hypothetical protein
MSNSSTDSLSTSVPTCSEINHCNVTWGFITRNTIFLLHWVVRQRPTELGPTVSDAVVRHGASQKSCSFVNGPLSYAFPSPNIKSKEIGRNACRRIDDWPLCSLFLQCQCQCQCNDTVNCIVKKFVGIGLMVICTVRCLSFSSSRSE